MSSVGVSKLGGIGGSSASDSYSSGPVWPAKKRRRKASAAARQAAATERAREVRRRFLGTGTPYTPQSVNFYNN